MTLTSLLPTNEARALDLTLATQAAEAGIVSRTVLHTPEVRVVLFTFADGQELTSHRNPRRAIVHILSGTCEFEFNGTRQILPTGSLLHLPPNHPHAVRAVHGPFAMLLSLAAESATAAA